MRYEGLLERQERGELSQSEAAELLGMGNGASVAGAIGCATKGRGAIGPAAGQALGAASGDGEIAWMLELYRGNYADFTVKHFHEQLVKRHGYKLGYTVTKVHLQRAGRVRRAERRSAHRKKRPRRPIVGRGAPGASKHAWLPGDAVLRSGDDAGRCDERDLLGLLVKEGTASSFRGLGEVIARDGLFWPSTPIAVATISIPRGRRGGLQDAADPGRPGPEAARHRAYRSYSPEARGRSERAFRTLQDRLSKELGSPRITTLEAANRWLARSYIPAHNARFAVAPEQAGSAFLHDPPGSRARSCASRRARRRQRQYRQMAPALPAIPPSRSAAALRQGRVRVHEYPDGSHRRLPRTPSPRRLRRQRQDRAATDKAARHASTTAVFAGACPGQKPQRSGQS